MDDKEKYMRWLETMWDLHNRISREKKRKAEVLEVFENLCLPLEAPHRRPAFSALGAFQIVKEDLLKSLAGPMPPATY